MQPLAISYFQSYKAACSRAEDNWMVSNAGKIISQFDAVGIFTTAYKKATAIKSYEWI